MAVALAFSLYTDHRWEDYYITFRSSKNLATGHGLVYQVGERVHTFTSPLGVLLPAFASWMTGATSDDRALWLFRFMSITAFAGTAALLWKTGRAWGWRTSVCGLAAALLVVDAKSVSFTINGMETGFMLFFLALAMHALAAAPRRARWHLGGAWAGLMWVRPDSFIYIGATALGFWLFPAAQKMAPTRSTLLRCYGFAGVICALIYGPWLVWAWSYYGSFVPHTVVAKGLSHQSAAILPLVKRLLLLPFQGWHSGPWDAVFSPSYWLFWPSWVIHLGRCLIVVPLVAFMIPRVRPEARVASLAVMFGVFYLSNIWLFPWYVPPVTLLAILTLGSLQESICDSGMISRRARAASLAPGIAAVGCAMLLLCASAWQLRWQQDLIEDQRRRVGEWLRAHRHADTDSVFLEPLGYIGYFSQLKMFDFPGLASREVVAVRRSRGGDWVTIIESLRPDWVVARPGEPRASSQANSAWFAAHYGVAERFDVSARVAAIPVLPGRRYLQVDQTFVVYQKLD